MRQWHLSGARRSFDTARGLPRDSGGAADIRRKWCFAYFFQNGFPWTFILKTKLTKAISGCIKNLGPQSGITKLKLVHLASIWPQVSPALPRRTAHADAPAELPPGHLKDRAGQPGAPGRRACY